MSEAVSPEFIGRRLDSLQNNIAGVNRRMIALETGLNERLGTVESRVAELGDCVDQLAERIGALETSVNSLILLVERVAKPGGRPPSLDT
jgi:hypothetical protein